MSKVIELIKSAQFSYSFEVTPDVSEKEIVNLEVYPAFFSVTWHAKSHQCKDMNIEPLQTASMLRRKGIHVLLHMSCDMMKTDYLKELLVKLQENDICNLFLVLGEAYDRSTSDFENTNQLIKFIRNQTGDHFCIGIAGFPGCSDEKLLQMKDKIESGADFIITQAFFDTKTFKNFAEQCKELNIKVPIIPGVFPFESYKQLTGFINLCKIKVSNDLLESVYVTEKLNKPCLEVIETLLQRLKDDCEANHVHFFTLNKLDRVHKFLHNTIYNKIE